MIIIPVRKGSSRRFGKINFTLKNIMDRRSEADSLEKHYKGKGQKVKVEKVKVTQYRVYVTPSSEPVKRDPTHQSVHEKGRKRKKK